MNKMKEVNIVIQDEDSKVLISMKPNEDSTMTTSIEFEPEVDTEDKITDAQMIGFRFSQFIRRGL
jgi:hypothetical protein